MLLSSSVQQLYSAISSKVPEMQQVMEVTLQGLTLILQQYLETLSGLAQMMKA